MPLTITNPKRGRPSNTLIQRAYLQGLEDGRKESDAGNSYSAGFKAGYQKAVDLYYQAIRFLKFEGTMEGTIQAGGHQNVNGIRRNEDAGSLRNQGGGGGDKVESEAFSNS